MANVVKTIRNFNAGRDPERLAMKYEKLRSSPFVFLRGTCHLFYDRLPADALFVKAPTAWLCGDAHLENFGSYKGDNRLAYFDLNDFDEAALAPVTWELVRFLTSILVAGDSLRASRDDANALCKVFLDGYAGALALGKARWVERDTAGGLIHDLLAKLKARTRPEFLDKRTERKKNGRRLILLDEEHALPADRADQDRAKKLVAAFAATQNNPGFFEVLHVAHRIAGTGSLGVERYVVLVKGKGSPDGNYLLDLKQAPVSSLVPHLKKIKQPVWPSNAHRVVGLQRRMQAVSMAFLHPIVDGKSSYVLRDLQPSEDRVTLDVRHTGLDQVRDVIGEMGQMMAWAHLRSSGRQGSAIADALVDFGASAKSWRRDLLDAAHQCAAQVESDWEVYCEAYDAGKLA
ncbi:DUF2252 domain-containing protein [Variovorax paradoxus]|uniref:DUF2252 domain-containing protein n=1 Tax=Variovorax paradoxus TaxID=34073 RepID=UPI0021AC1522|nr:DUF2252 domain-containing protein [Variovorax paradoxus]UVH59344.1 DUF2252 domain-containing protein [Variovorax paradoxus]